MVNQKIEDFLFHNAFYILACLILTVWLGGGFLSYIESIGYGSNSYSVQAGLASVVVAGVLAVAGLFGFAIHESVYGDEQ